VCVHKAPGVRNENLAIKHSLMLYYSLMLHNECFYHHGRVWQQHRCLLC